jgi:hypothetical protein
MRLILPVVFAVGIFYGGFALGYYRRPTDPRIVALREHARLLERAGKASRRGQHGLAEIYERGAQEALELADAEPRKELGP